MSKIDEIKDGHIGIYELIGLLTITMATKAFLTIPRTAMILNLQGGWIFFTSAIIFALGSFFLILKLFRLFPGYPLDEINVKVLGPWLGIPINLTIIVFFVLFLIVNLREFTELVVQSILPNTPISNLLIFFMIVVCYGTYLGLEAIGRSAWLQAPFLLLAYVLFVLLSAPNAHLDNMYPILGRGIFQGIKAGFISISRFGEGILCLGLVIPFIRKNEDVAKIGYISILSSGFIVLSAIVIYQMVFGVPTGIVSGTFPIYKVVRLISYGTFFQRIEAVFVFIWILSALLTVSCVFYSLNLIIARQLKLPTFRPLIFPMGLIIYTVAFLPTDFLTTVELEMTTVRKYGIIPTAILPIFVYIVAKMKGYKGGRADEKKVK